MQKSGWQEPTLLRSKSPVELTDTTQTTNTQNGENTLCNVASVVNSSYPYLNFQRELQAIDIEAAAAALAAE